MDCFAHFRKQDNAFQTNEQHLEGTAILAKSFCNKIGMPSWGELIGLLHDLGKYSQLFQNYFLSSIGIIKPDNVNHIDPKTHRGKIDHATAGGQFIWNNFNDTDIQKLISQTIALCIVSHHGGLANCLNTDGTDVFTLRIAKDYSKTSYTEILSKIDKSIISRIHLLLHSGEIEKELLSSLNAIALAKMSPLVNRFYIGCLVKFFFSCLVDADRIDAACFDDPARIELREKYPAWKTLIAEFDNYIELYGLKKNNVINEIRSNISDVCCKMSECEKGNYLLTLPTGSGKTLASLRFALNHAAKHQMDRIIYVIPYTSIIDQNAKIMRSIFKQLRGRQVVLEHHSNLLPSVDNEQNQILSENWDAPIVVTTMVQFLDVLFSSGTRGLRRMHQLANAIIIFDEIQTLPIKTVHLFNNAMNFLVNSAGTTAVYCTATQPLLNKVDTSRGALVLSNPASIVDLDPAKQAFFNRATIVNLCRDGGWTNDEIVEEMTRNLQNYCSVLMIVNTKEVAMSIYKLCKEKIKTKNIFHLSTGMCPVHRKRTFRRINKLLDENANPIVCVSTQLVEAGVDVDFGCVMRSLAGLDSIAQAAGRCNRHGLRQSGKVIVFNSNKENLSKLREIRIAQEKTLRVFNEMGSADNVNEVTIDNQSMNLYYKYYFHDRKHEMVYPIGIEDIGRNDSLLNLLSENVQSVDEYKRNNKADPAISLRQSFKTAGELFEAIDAPTHSVIVPYGKAGQYIINRLNEIENTITLNKLLKRAQRYSVNLFPYLFETLLHDGCIKKTKDEIMYLVPEYYSMEFGVSSKPVEDMPFLYC